MKAIFCGKMVTGENFDIILCNTTITSSLFESGMVDSNEQEMLNKFIAIAHCPVLCHPKYCENISNNCTNGPLIGSTSELGIENIKKDKNVDCSYTPCGVDLDHFYKTRDITEIKSIGFVGSLGVDGYTEGVKRNSWFEKIVDQTELKGVYINGRPFIDNKDMYQDIDLLVCCSTFEGGPLGIFEAGACAIPVLSTPVGNVTKVKSIKTFETIQEAVGIIKTLNGNSKMLSDYIRDTTMEIRKNWNWEVICKQYWQPLFEQRMK